jgi:hypothetical protein
VSALDLSSFQELTLPQGLILASIKTVPGPLIDPIGRSALAKTTIESGRLWVVFDETQDPEEQSVSIYHELLEGVVVAASFVPAAASELCEVDFERAARDAHARLGVAGPENVLLFLSTDGFR